MIPLLLFLLPLASCHITISIRASNSSSTSSITTRGNDAGIITDRERTTFGLTDEVLKNAAEKFSGGRPQDVFLHSPTPWNDLYTTYGWRQVHRILQPTKSHILDVQTSTDVINLKQLDNNSPAAIKFNASLLAEVENVVKNKWNKAGVLDIKDLISYNVDGSVVFAFTSPWGMDAIQSKKIIIGSDSNVELVLQPGDTVTASLSATKVTITFQIDYVANLSGHVACNYPKKYNGHHFWRYEINGLLAASNLIRSVNSSEVISVQFYTDASIIVANKATNAKITEVPVEFVTS